MLVFLILFFFSPKTVKSQNFLQKKIEQCGKNPPNDTLCFTKPKYTQPKGIFADVYLAINSIKFDEKDGVIKVHNMIQIGWTDDGISLGNNTITK